MNLATSSIVDFESVLLRSTKETAGNFLVLPGWLRHCLRVFRKCGIRVAPQALNLSLEKLFLPVLTFRMAAGKVPGSLWRLVS